MQPITSLVPFSKTVPRDLKVQQWGGFPSDHGGLVEVRGAVLALRRVAPAVGRLGAPHLALALPQLGDVALEAEAELRVLSLGCFQCPLL